MKSLTLGNNGFVHGLPLLPHYLFLLAAVSVQSLLCRFHRLLGTHVPLTQCCILDSNSIVNIVVVISSSTK